MTARQRILIVDDLPANLAALRQVLSGLDAQIVEASSGNEALKAALDGDFALAILDVSMPEMDGFELARLLREDPPTSCLPIIFVTATYDEEEQVFKGYETGAVDFLIKPYDPRVLLSKVGVFLELRRTQSELERHRNQLEVLVAERTAELQEAKHLAGLGHWRWDLVGNTHTWSEEIHEIYGHDPILPPVGYPELGRYFTPASWSPLAAAFERAVAEGLPFECDAEVCRADGEHRWITFRGRALRDADGKVAALHGTAQDITRRKQAELEVRLLNETLELRVQERTNSLAASNRELEAFSYSVSHDLRAPLRALDGFSHLLETDYASQLDENGLDYLHRIRAASQHMGELIDDMIEMGRIGRQELMPVELDLAVPAREIAEQLREQSPPRKVQWTIPAGLKVRADPKQVRVLLENLLRNAWKYTAERDEARIELGRRQIDGKEVFFVRDNGAGFDPAYANKLFKPFQRLHNSSRFPGTGIGLAIVSRIVQHHGGRAWAEGAPEQGATFYFSLS